MSESILSIEKTSMQDLPDPMDFILSFCFVLFCVCSFLVDIGLVQSSRLQAWRLKSSLCPQNRYSPGSQRYCGSPPTTVLQCWQRGTVWRGRGLLSLHALQSRAAVLSSPRRGPSLQLHLHAGPSQTHPFHRYPEIALR